MFNFIRDKLKIEGKHLKTLVVLILIAVLYAILILMNVTDVGVSFDRITTEFLVKYFMAVGFSLSTMFLIIWWRKEKLRMSPKITDSLEYIYSIREAMVEKGLYDDFKTRYLTEQNRKIKLSTYRQNQLNRRDRAEWYMSKVRSRKLKERLKSLVEKYDALYKQSFDEGFNIEAQNVKIRELNVNTIFLGIKDASGGGAGKIYFSGFEGFTTRVLPSVIFSIFLTMMVYAMLINGKESTLEVWKNTLTVVGMSISYMLTGVSFAEYSINTVYYGVLSSRADIPKTYLAEKGLGTYVEDNPTYKYKTKILTKQEAEDGHQHHQ